jgi:hypothetical protein
MPLGVGGDAAGYGYGGQNPYFQSAPGYDPSNPFGGGFPTAPIGDLYLNRGDPRAAYAIQTAPFGGGFSPYDQFVQSQFGAHQDAYRAHLAYDPNKLWTDYLSEFASPGVFAQQFRRLAPSQRGESPGRTAGYSSWALPYR